MESRTYYYARVSSREQNLDRQLEAFRAMNADQRNIFTEKASGKDFNRPVYNTLRGQILRRGDTLVIKSLDRLSRNKAELKDEIASLQRDGIRLKVIDIPTTMVDFPDEYRSGAWVMDMVTNILIEVLASMAEQERAYIRQRQREGLDAMQLDEQGRRVSNRKGTHAGRPDIQKPANWDEVIKLWQAEQITAVEAMKRMNLKKNSFYRLVKKEGAAK
jgi:DNA invertase Pin-like site-specific DNA recombinase